MSLAIAERPASRRQATESRMDWRLPGSNAVSQRSAPANVQSDVRGQLDELDDRIGSKYDRIAVLMHERNAQPEDKEVAARLQAAFEELRVLQHERAERMSAYFRPKPPVSFDESSYDVKRAKDILKRYENTPSDDASLEGPVHPKP